jgi:pyruvate,water dikinase
MNKISYIRWFNEIGLDDVPLVGGKNASLGEMYQNMTTEGVRVPNGFAVTAEAYRYVLEHNKAWQPLHEALDCESDSCICHETARIYPVQDLSGTPIA